MAIPPERIVSPFRKDSHANSPRAWNKGRLLGQKPPLKPNEIWSIRIRLQLAGHARDLALINLALDSKLRGCDLTAPRVRDLFLGGTVVARAIVMQRKTQRPVQFPPLPRCGPLRGFESVQHQPHFPCRPPQSLLSRPGKPSRRGSRVGSSALVITSFRAEGPGRICPFANMLGS